MSQGTIIMCAVVGIAAIGIATYFIGRSLRYRFSRTIGQVVIGLSYAISGIAALLAVIVLTGI